MGGRTEGGIWGIETDGRRDAVPLGRQNRREREEKEKREGSPVDEEKRNIVALGWLAGPDRRVEGSCPPIRRSGAAPNQNPCTHIKQFFLSYKITRCLLDNWHFYSIIRCMTGKPLAVVP